MRATVETEKRDGLRTNRSAARDTVSVYVPKMAACTIESDGSFVKVNEEIFSDFLRRLSFLPSLLFLPVSLNFFQQAEQVI